MKKFLWPGLYEVGEMIYGCKGSEFICNKANIINYNCAFEEKKLWCRIFSRYYNNAVSTEEIFRDMSSNIQQEVLSIEMVETLLHCPLFQVSC